MTHDHAILDRCRKLQALAASTSFPAEKKSASSMRRQLMKRHGIKAKDLKAPKPRAVRRLTDEEMMQVGLEILFRRFGEKIIQHMQSNLCQ